MKTHRQKHERGVALLMVLSVLALVGSVVADFQFTSRVDYQLAINARDELQAEYNALSALRMRAMLLKQTSRLQSVLGTALAALGGGGSAGGGQTPSVAQFLEMIPVNCGILSGMTQYEGETQIADEEGEGFFPGDCSATSKSERSKIAVNLLSSMVGGRSQDVVMQLLGVLSDGRLKKYFEEDDANGSHAENPMQLVAALTDWSDYDHVSFGTQVGDEDRHYDMLKEGYKAKNAPFDSVAEIQLVHGVNDALFDILQDYITVYSDSHQIELATASLEQIVVGLAACLRDGVYFDQFASHPGAGVIVSSIMAAKQLGGPAAMMISIGALQGLVASAGLTGILDEQKLARVFTDQVNTTWYTIEAEGQVGRAVKRMKAVFQTGESQFYYFRVE